MPIVSLIAKPGSLDPVLVDSLRNAWGGGTATWLAPDEAAEFAIPAIPDTVDAARADIAAEADLNILPDGPREKTILIADMDSTMIDQECIDELAEAAGIGDAIRVITARAMNGELNFETALTERVAQLAGLPETTVTEVLESRITLAAGGMALLATMRARGAHCALVSGGFTAFTGPIAARLGFHEHRANTLIAESGMLTGRVAQPILGRDAKVAALQEMAAARGLTPSDAIAVGDGANDLGMLDIAGLGVALHAKPAVQAQAQCRVNHGDLTALLYLQGIARAEFVTG
jgi:phosphoserine phosphatase